MDTQEPWKPLVVPEDEEGYCQSFLSSDDALVEFFFKYGFAVIRDVLSPEKVKSMPFPDILKLNFQPLLKKFGPSSNPKELIPTQQLG